VAHLGGRDRGHPLYYLLARHGRAAELHREGALAEPAPALVAPPISATRSA